jgi:hypothetical protein
MWCVEHEGRVRFFNAVGSASASAKLPDNVVALGLGPEGAAALCSDGAILAIQPDGSIRPNRRIDLPAGVARAAISADGSLIVVSERIGQDGLDVFREENGAWHPVRTPDFLCAVMDVRCAPDGKSFGYTYRTGQPWSDYGSYGSRMYGAAVLAADGTVLRQDWETRYHDESPEIDLAWGAGGDPLVLSMGETTRHFFEVIVSWGQPRTSPYHSWECGPLDSPPLESELRFSHTIGAKAIAVSPGGDIVGILAPWGEVTLVDRPGRRRCTLFEDAKEGEGAVAIELLGAPLIGWMTADCVWKRAPASAFAWESLSEGQLSERSRTLV